MASSVEEMSELRLSAKATLPLRWWAYLFLMAGLHRIGLPISQKKCVDRATSHLLVEIGHIRDRQPPTP